MPIEEVDKQGGFSFELTEVLETGMYPRVFSQVVPLWEEATNVKFTEFGVEKVEGRVTMTTLDGGDFLCSALETYIKASSDLHAYGVFSDNKANGQNYTYDESGNGNTWAFPTGFDTASRFILGAFLPSTCAEGQRFLQVTDGIKHPLEIVPSGDVEYVKNGWVCVGGVVRLDDADIGSAFVPLAMVGKFRQNGFALGIENTGNTLVFRDRDNTDTPFLSGTVEVPVLDWCFVHVAYHTVTGQMIGWFNGYKDSITLSNTYPAYPDSDSYVAGVMCALWNYNDVTEEVRNSLVSGWVIDGYMDGAEAYVAYLRTLPSPLTPDLVSGYSNTVLSYEPEFYWKLDDASGDAVDTQGNLSLNFTGTPTYDSGDIMNEAGAISYDGVAYCGALGGEGIYQTELTIGGWMEVGDPSLGSGLETLIQSGFANVARGWSLFFNSSTGGLQLINHSTGVTAYSALSIIGLTIGTIVFWTMHHRQGDKPNFFINGVSVGTTDIVVRRPYPQNLTPVFLGAYRDAGISHYMTGSLSKVFVIPQEVPAARILHMYNEGKL